MSIDATPLLWKKLRMNKETSWVAGDSLAATIAIIDDNKREVSKSQATP
jgi:hypothetical protein